MAQRIKSDDKVIKYLELITLGIFSLIAVASISVIFQVITAVSGTYAEAGSIIIGIALLILAIVIFHNAYRIKG